MDTMDLPLTEGGLRAFSVRLGLGPERLPFWTDDGQWALPLESGWPGRWDREPDLAGWRARADPRYEGLEDPEPARLAMAEGRLPGHLVDDPQLVRALWGDGSGNIYLQLAGVRTTDGHSPVFFFDHDKKWTVTACARTLPELYARAMVQVWMDEQGRDRDVEAILAEPIALEPSSIAVGGDALADGWRDAVGLPPRREPAPPRQAPVRAVVVGAALQDCDQLEAYQPQCVQRYILARAVDADALTDLVRPLTWWKAGTFVDLDASLRNLMARLAALAAQPVGEGATRSQRRAHQRDQRELLAGATFLDGLYQRRELSIAPSQCGVAVVRRACDFAIKRIAGGRFTWGLPAHDDGQRCIDRVPEMLAFHAGWAGIVPDEVLSQGDHMSFAVAKKHCADLTLLHDTVFSLLRTSGDAHLGAISALLPTLLPRDQVTVLNALENFPKHPGVLALYDQVISDTPYEYVRDAVTRYRRRVVSGVKPSGWDL